MIPTTDTTLHDFLHAMQQYNLVYNYDFRYYSNQIQNGNVIEYGVPDGWVYSDSGVQGKISFDPATNECILVKSEDDSLLSFTQNIQEFPRWKSMLLGMKITAKVILNISIEGAVNITLSDGISSNTVTKSGQGDFEIDVQSLINHDATFVSIAITSRTPFVTISISKVYANIGEVAIENLPCIVQGVIGERKQYLATETPPAGEFSLCASPQELNENYTRLNAVINKRYGVGYNGGSLLPNMSGYFSRAWDNGAAVDPNADERMTWGGSSVSGDHVSTLEDDEFLSHDHALDFVVGTATIVQQGDIATIITTDTSTTERAGKDETRPKNITELYTMKWA